MKTIAYSFLLFFLPCCDQPNKPISKTSTVNLTDSTNKLDTMTQVITRLEHLESMFQKANAPILKYLTSALPENEIKNFFTENNIPIHPDLLALYEWHNGVKSIYGIQPGIQEIIPGYCFPNLKEMNQLRIDFLAADYIKDINKQKFVPILSGGEDAMFLLNTSTGEIFESNPSIQVDCELAYKSLSSFLDFIINSYEKRLLTIHPEKGLEVSEEYWNSRSHYEH